MALTGTTVIALEWSMLSLTLSLVILRLYLRRRLLNKFTYSDFFVILAWLSFALQTSMDTALYKLGLFENKISSSAKGYGPQYGLATYDDTVSALKIVYVETCLYYTTFYLVKWSMLAFYNTLFPHNMRILRLAMWITVGLTIIGWISSLFVKMFLCQPMTSNWTPGPEFCDPMRGTIGNAVRWSQHVFTDVLVYILPLFLLRRIRLRTTQKIGVAATFVIGFTCIAFACMEQIAIETKCRNVIIWLYSDMEQTWAMVVVCCPAFRSLFKGWGPRRRGETTGRTNRSLNEIISGGGGRSGKSGSDILSNGGLKGGGGGISRGIGASASVSVSNGSGGGSDKQPLRGEIGRARDTDLDTAERGRSSEFRHSQASLDDFEDEKRHMRQPGDSITVTYEIRSNATVAPTGNGQDKRTEPKVTTLAWSSCN